MPPRLEDTLRHPAALVPLWAGAVVVVAIFIGHFWIPLDDGTLAQSAERVLAGELPHRDFGDPYSGLGAVLGALAFRLFGVSLISLRIPLAIGFAAWLPAVWLIARRFSSPPVAVAATLLAAVLSVPAYPAAMPTWYGLFLATWCTWLLLRFLEGGGRGWLVAAGVAAGVSTLFKVVGLYALAALLLGLAWHRADGSRAHRLLVAAGCAAFVLLLARMVLPGTGVSGFYHFLLPALALCGSLVGRAWRPTQPPRPGGASELVRDGAALAVGVAIPAVLFLAPYAASGSVAAWIEGVFVLPTRRLATAASPPGSFATVLPGVCAVALVAVGARLAASRARRLMMAAAVLLALAVSLDDAAGGGVFAALWYSARGWIPALTVWGALVTTDPRRWAVMAMAALWALVQFPYAAPAYFFYVAPLGVLATLAVVYAPPPTRAAPTPSRRTGTSRIGSPAVLGLVAGVYAFLGLGYATGVVTSSDERLDLERGGLVVPSAQAALYHDLVAEVRAHAEGGGLWAGPDAPQVYFLTGIPNRTPTLYEFLSPETADSRPPHALLQGGTIQVVVVNTRPLFSRPLAPEDLRHLAADFPASREIGSFIVRWRAP